MTHRPPARDREYDRFGPWVLEINDDDPAPPLFLPHLTRTNEAVISIKVPRKVARRDAHPGMDLYDFVVSLYEQDIVILERIGSDVHSRTIAYRDVKQLHISEELLRGDLHLGVADAPYDLPYNTVSAEVMRRVADHIRARYLDPAHTPVTLPTEGALSELSFYFERLRQAEREADSPMLPLAAQADVALRGRESSVLRRLLFGIVDKRLLESLHLSDGRELRVIDRGRRYAYRWQTTYGRRETTIPLANITSVDWSDDVADTMTLTVTSDGGQSHWAFTRDTETGSYRDWLASLPITHR